MTDNLLEVPAKEVASKFGYYTDEAMLHPVGIQRHGTTRVVMISLKEYQRLLRRDRQVVPTKDLDDGTLDAILNAEIPEKARRLDHLIDDPAAEARFVQEQRVSPLSRDAVVERLRAHETELKDMGVERLSLFGSVARGEAGAGSDVDLAAELDRNRKIDLFHYGAIAERLEALLGVKVDLLTEPARKPRMQAEIDRDRVNVF